MSNSESGPNYGAALFRYLETFWNAEGKTMSGWGVEHGITSAQLSRWGSGQEPGAASLRRVADAVQRPILDVLIATGLVTEEEAQGRVPTPPASPPSLDDALAAEGLVSKAARDSILKIVEEFIDALNAPPKRPASRRSRRSGK